MPISKISFVRATVLALLVGFGALLVIVAVNVWLVGQTRGYSDLVTGARLERSAIADLRNMLNDAETGQRGYLLTGDPDYLAPYNNAEKQHSGSDRAGPNADRGRCATGQEGRPTDPDCRRASSPN